MSLTRRAFLERLGVAGGVSATYLGMQAMGLLATPAAAASTPFALPPGSGRGRSVVILGAGIAGLVAAYELRKAGWTVTLLEARERIGGRVWTVRNGDRVVQTGRPDQRCQYTDGLYFNAGAARIPHAHHVILGYARQFGVPIEVMVNSNRAGRIDVGGRVIENRQLINDVRGRVAELLSKAIGRGALDAQMSAGEKEAMRQFLGFYGELADSGDYNPRGRSGYAELPGAYEARGRFASAASFQELLSDRRIALPLMFEEFFDQQSPMFQPVGGMDRIAAAIAGEVGDTVKLNSPITQIRRAGERVRIHHGPGNRVTEADYCVCTLPLNLLSRIPSDFSPAKRAAMNVPYLPSVKVAFESRRFWEEDDNIYGGLGWTDRIVENLIYPSGGWNAPSGILVAAYCAGWMDNANPDRLAAMSHEERFQACREAVERLHPGKARELGRPLTVAWGMTPWSEGVGPLFPDVAGGTGARDASYAELMKPEGPIFFAGEHLSHVVFWQEGAALSAHEATRRLTQAASQRRAAT